MKRNNQVNATSKKDDVLKAMIPHMQDGTVELLAVAENTILFDFGIVSVEGETVGIGFSIGVMPFGIAEILKSLHHLNPEVRCDILLVRRDPENDRQTVFLEEEALDRLADILRDRACDMRLSKAEGEAEKDVEARRRKRANTKRRKVS